MTGARSPRAHGVGTSTVYKLCAEGKLGHVRVSNAIRIPEVALSAYGSLGAKAD